MKHLRIPAHHIRQYRDVGSLGTLVLSLFVFVFVSKHFEAHVLCLWQGLIREYRCRIICVKHIRTHVHLICQLFSKRPWQLCPYRGVDHLHLLHRHVHLHLRLLPNVHCMVFTPSRLIIVIVMGGRWGTRGRWCLLHRASTKVNKNSDMRVLGFGYMQRYKSQTIFSNETTKTKQIIDNALRRNLLDAHVKSSVVLSVQQSTYPISLGNLVATSELRCAQKMFHALSLVFADRTLCPINC